MLAISTNGYTSAQVIDAVKAKTGTIERRFRAELLDKNNNVIRETDNIIGGNIKHVHNQRMKRGGSATIRHQSFTLTSTYVATGQSGTELLMSTYPVQVTNESPLLYWRLGDTSGTSAVDASGNGRTGTYTGGFTLNQNSLLAGDTTNGAVLFNGSTGYITRASESAFNVSSFSVEAWIKTSYTGARQTIISRDNTTTNRQFILRTLATSDTGQVGYIEVVLFVGGSTTAIRFTGPANVCDGRWHHVVGTYDGANVKIYVDRKIILTTAETGALNSITEPLIVGALNGGNFFNGTLDEVAFYGYAMTAAQVTSHYQAGANDLREINYLLDKVKIYCDIKMPTAGTDGSYWAGYPLGIFVFGFPVKVIKKTGIEYRAQLFDQSYLLDKRKISTPYTIASGTNYQTALAAVLVAAGLTSSQYSITPTSSTLPAQKNWGIGTSYLDMANDLLRAINYRELHFNGNGVAVCEPYVLPSARASEYSYTADANSILVNAFELSTNVNETFNKVILERKAPKLGNLVSTASNMTISHPTSIPSLQGEIFLYHDPNVDAADQTTLDGLAQRKLTEVSEVFEEIKRQTPLIPFHDDLDKITLTDETNSISADFLEYEWDIPLVDTGAMTHVWKQTIAVV